MKSKAICILGMHRSGTSILTKIMSLMGLDLGKAKNLAQAQADNPDGFWEHVEIVDIHNKILNTFESSWESTTPLPYRWWEYPSIRKYKAQLIEIIKSEFNNSQIWGWKDPRTCIMLPLWKEIFEVLQLDVTFVIPIRNPVDIANSIKRRDNIPLKQGIRLWYYYMLNILKETEKHKRLFIQYDDIIENIEDTVKEIANYLQITLTEEIKQNVSASVKPSLRHSKTSIRELELIGGRQAANLYTECLSFVNKIGKTKESIQLLCDMYDQYSELMDTKSVDKKSMILISSLYINNGSGFREELSVKRLVALMENGEFEIKFSLGDLGDGITELRWDPLEGQLCRCSVTNIVVDNNQTNVLYTNAFKQIDNEYEFLTCDPIFFIKVDNQSIKTVSISGRIHFYQVSDIESIVYSKIDELTGQHETMKISIEVLENKLCECDNLIKDLANKNNQLTEQSYKLINENETDKVEIENLNIERQELNEKLVKIETAFNEVNLKNKQLSIQIDELKVDNDKLLQERNDAEKVILSVNSSFSWRITKPLRALGSIIKKV